MNRQASPSLHILVTGAAGYIGCALVQELLRQGHHVHAVDSMIFGQRPLRALMPHPRLQVLCLDTRALNRAHLKGITTIVDLAGLSSELAAELNPAWTDAVNHRAQVRLAQLARHCGVARYILISNCTVYGQASDAECHEDTPTQPLSCHAHASLQAEKTVLALGNEHFTPAALRLGLVHGHSGRMRFDLPINAMALSALRLRRITLDNGGQRIRGHLHLDDAIHGIVAAVNAPTNRLSGQCFNLSHHSTSSAEIADVLRIILGNDIEICTHGAAPDLNHHRPSIAKATQLLGYTPSVSMVEGVHALLMALDPSVIAHPPQTNAERWVLEVLAQGREATAAVEHTAFNSYRCRTFTRSRHTYATSQRYPLH